MHTAGSILVVDDNPEVCDLVAELLREAGLQAVDTCSSAEALRKISDDRPQVILLDLNMPEPDGYEIIRQVKGSSDPVSTAVIVMTGSSSAESSVRAFELGADDYVTKPFSRVELVARVKSQLRSYSYRDRLQRSERSLKSVVVLTQTLASSHNIRDILFTVVRRIAEVVEIDRCSIVLVHEDQEVGYVIATSDDEELRDLPIRLDKYPEIREVLATRRPLVIEDVSADELLAAVDQDTKIAFRSLALTPIVHEGEPMGVIFLRTRRPGAFHEEGLALVHSLANAAAVAIRNARVLQSLRSASEQDAQARLQAERRVRLFQRYADFFESAADGMVVTDQQGHILFANPRARAIIGVSAEEAKSTRIFDLLARDEETRADRLLQGFRDGVYPQGVDISARTPSGENKILSVNFSSVLRAEHAVLFTFRDVTSERHTAVELRQTKEFLERVIESSVDAIVTADLAGQVLLFNRAAARIFGYDPRDVIGKLNVEKLYPPGVAREVMRKIRSPEYGGMNRLEEYRVDMQTATGELVPVKICAAMIIDKEKPVGSVGIFTDVRESLRMEAELMKALEDLRRREKGEAVAHLAGATAHELNQPLTSVIGYAELLLRHLDSASPLRNAANVIISEAERMAEIVRKIGKITKYETMSYVGGAQILDLEKASAEAPEEGDR